MALLFSSGLLTCSNVASHELQNVVIDDSNRRIDFQFNKKVGENLIPITPNRAKYSFTTKIFDVEFEANQLNLNDQFEMIIITRAEIE